MGGWGGERDHVLDTQQVCYPYKRDYTTCLLLHRPLHLAASNGMVPVVQELIVRGANLLAQDEDGHSPALACAPNPQVADCLALILTAMIPSMETSRSGSVNLRNTDHNPMVDSVDFAATHNATV